MKNKTWLIIGIVIVLVIAIFMIIRSSGNIEETEEPLPIIPEEEIEEEPMPEIEDETVLPVPEEEVGEVEEVVEE
jgi:hypothetical protein